MKYGSRSAGIFIAWELNYLGSRSERRLSVSENFADSYTIELDSLNLLARASTSSDSLSSISEVPFSASDYIY